jgi:hypothetical protein
MKNKFSSMLDSISNSLEKKGLIKEAYEIDKIADSLEADSAAEYYEKYRPFIEEYLKSFEERVTPIKPYFDKFSEGLQHKLSVLSNVVDTVSDNLVQFNEKSLGDIKATGAKDIRNVEKVIENNMKMLKKGEVKDLIYRLQQMAEFVQKYKTILSQAIEDRSGYLNDNSRKKLGL